MFWYDTLYKKYPDIFKDLSFWEYTSRCRRNTRNQKFSSRCCEDYRNEFVDCRSDNWEVILGGPSFRKEHKPNDSFDVNLSEKSDLEAFVMHYCTLVISENVIIDSIANFDKILKRSTNQFILCLVRDPHEVLTQQNTILKFEWRFLSHSVVHLPNHVSSILCAG